MTLSGGLKSASKSWALFLIFIFLYITYLPLARGYFLVSRDYWGFVYEHPNFFSRLAFNAEGDAGSYGRPLAGYIMSFFTSLITTIARANLVRLALILLLILEANLFFIWLRIHNTDKINAIFISVAVFTLPPFQSIVSSVCQAPVLISLLLSTCAGFLLRLSLCTFGTRIPNAVRMAYGILTVVLFFLSLITYPLGAMFFWTMLSVLIGRSDIATFIKNKTQIALSFCVPFLILGVYFLFFRLTQKVLPETEVVFHPLGRLRWFVDQPFFVALNLWNIHKLSVTSFFVGGVLFLGSILAITKDVGRRSSAATNHNFIKYVFLKYLALILLLPLSILPLMVVENYNFLSFRHLVALSPIVFLAFLWSAARMGSFWGRGKRAVILTIGFAITCCYGMWSAYANVSNNIAVPMSAEFKCFKETLSQYEPSEIKRIHVIASTKRHRTLLQNYEEFSGFQSALGIPYDGAFNPALVMAAIKELAREDKRFAAARKDWNIGRAVDAVTYSTKEDFERKIIFNPQSTALIDMTQKEFLIDPGILQENEPFISNNTTTSREDASSFRGISGSTPPNFTAGPNQCRGGGAISGGDFPGFPAAQAFDGDSMSTRWSSQQTGSDISGVAYIGYDFGDGLKKHIRRFVIRQGGAIPSVVVQRSENGNSWRDVTTISLETDNNFHHYDLPVSGASRFWRLLIINTNVGEGASVPVYEIEMMELQ